MSEWSSSPVAVLVADPPPLNRPRFCEAGAYLFEVLEHAGIPYRRLSLAAGADMTGVSVLITVGEPEAAVSCIHALRAWLECGGVWISIAGLHGEPDLFGVKPCRSQYTGIFGTAEQISLGEGYLEPTPLGRDQPIAQHIDHPLHFFGGLAAEATDAAVLARVRDAHGQPTDRVGVSQCQRGEGLAVFIGSDLTGSIVRIQQGISVGTDRVSSADGTAPSQDGILKSDDGAVLDPILDRQDVPGVTGLRAYLTPVADQWRQLLIRAILAGCRRAAADLPMLWLYPGTITAIAHMSHDTDGNDPQKASHLLEQLQAADIRSTWCVIRPGYEPDVIARIREAGHELAMHFDALTPGHDWTRAQFTRQALNLADQLGAMPRTNKNHYLRWEGGSQLIEWCEAHGLLLDQSKGPAKPGEAGFLFGTCHPYRYVRDDGRLSDVLELPTHTQDLAVFVEPEVLPHLIRAVLAQHGVLHLLFHPSHVDKQAVREAIARAVTLAREAGLEWWTSERLARWERARRAVRWQDPEADDAAVALHLPDEIADRVTLLWLMQEEDKATSAADGESEETMRCWGFEFRRARLERRGDAFVARMPESECTLALDGRSSPPMEHSPRQG